MEAERESEPGTAALDLFAEFLEQREAEAAALDRLCADHPEHARLFRRWWDELEAIGEVGGVGKPPDPPVGERCIGRYRIVREIGRGGQGVVYFAEDTQLPRHVALKVLTGITFDQERLARFRREVEIACKLDDPGICTVYEIGTHGSTPWHAMRFVPGESLDRKIARTRARCGEGGVAAVALEIEDGEAASPDSTASSSRGSGTRKDVEAAVLLVEELARTIHRTHEAGIVHRDVKPGNVMVTRQGRPVILDFGTAQDLESDGETLTRTGETPGTPAYMSPEQLGPQHARVDRTTDIWSLGVTLYECLTLVRPFQGPTRLDLCRAIQSDEPPDPCKLNPAIPRDLGVVLATAMEKSRDRRYRTALALADDLRRVRLREPILSRPAGLGLRLRRWAQRRPGVAAGLALAILGLLAGLGVSLVLLARTNSALSREATALRGKESAHVRYQQVSDPALLHFLTHEAAGLWPRREAKIAAMEAWIGRARTLRDRFARRSQELAELRRLRGVPVATDSSAVLELLRTRHPGLFEQLASYRERVEAVKHRLEHPSSEAVQGRLEARLEHFQEELERLESDPRLQLVAWRFETTEDADLHRSLTSLVQEATRFEALIQDVESRVAFARDVRERTIEDHEAAWKLCVAELASDPGAPILTSPQVGLVPLGKDRHSGLWEFWHPGSGLRPEWSGDHLAGAVKINADSGIVLVLLPGGRFSMGAQSTDERSAGYDPNAEVNEAPVNEVVIGPFFLSKFELTQGQWMRITGSNPSDYNPTGRILLTRGEVTLQNPVEQVSWEECREILGRLDLMLPTEAQWEYAARAGTSSRWWTGDTADSLSRRENVADRSAGAIGMKRHEPTVEDGWGLHAPVGSLAPNAFGLFDMLGNVREWCRDEVEMYERPPRKGDGLRSALHLLHEEQRVFRGASWRSLTFSARCANRNYVSATQRFGDLGCRPAARIVP